MEYKPFKNNKNILNSNIDYNKLKILVNNSKNYIKENFKSNNNSSFILKINQNKENKKFKIFEDLVNPIFEDWENSWNENSFDSHSNSIKLSKQFGIESSLIMSPRFSKINNNNNVLNNDNEKNLLTKTLSLINSFEEKNKKLSFKEKLKLKKSKMEFETPLTTFRSNNNKPNTYKIKRKFERIPENNKEYDINLKNLKTNKNTTLMIRNIPNKYTKEIMLNIINKNFLNKYNFFYLPIDFQNKCNVGYAFINFKETKYIKKFYLQFNNKKWNSSKKICEIKYARIQGPEEYNKHFEGKTITKYLDSSLKPLMLENLDNIHDLVEKQKNDLKNLNN